MSMEEDVRALLSKRAKEVAHFNDYSFEVRGNAKRLDITIESMYSLGGFINFGFLSEVSELLGTKSIDLEDEYHTPGCDTCDYGSCSSATIVVKNINYKE